MTTVAQKKRSQSKDSGANVPKDRTASQMPSRIPPHSIDVEQALIACCVFEGGMESVTACVEGKISPSSFYKPAHQSIFHALLDLYTEGKAIDELILAEKLKTRGQFEEVGGFAYLNEVMNRIDTPAHLPYYIERVRDLSLLRRLINTSVKTIEEAYNQQDDLQQFLEHVEQEIFSIGEDRITESAKPIRDSVENAVNIVNKMLKNRGELTGLTTGFIDLDKMTSGLHKQEMIVVAGRPSMGKTSIALNMCEAVIMNKTADKRAPTLVFSLEMSADQLAMRLLCSRANVDMQKLKDGFIERDAQGQLAVVSKELREAPLWIDDAGFMSILEMRAKARRLHAQRQLGLIIIDYLQLISGTDSRVSREQQIAEISRGIKAMAKELNVPVIVAAQLNRESEKEKRQPRISDLRESGSIEQDADLILLISKKKDFDEEEDRNSPVVMRDLIVAKHRNGPVGSVPLTYNKRFTRFENFIGEPQ